MKRILSIALLFLSWPLPASAQPTVQLVADRMDTSAEPGEAPAPKSLTLLRAVSVHNAGGAATFTPSLTTYSSFCIRCQAEWFRCDGTVGLSLKPEPIAGDADDVAERIRVSADLVELTVGLYAEAFAKRAQHDGPLGVQLAFGAAALLQRAHVAVEENQLALQDFGMVAVDATGGTWIVYGYGGNNLRYYRASGPADGAEPLVDAIDGLAHRMVAILPVNLLLSSSDDGRKLSDIYIQLSVTADGTSDDVAAAISFAFTFELL